MGRWLVFGGIFCLFVWTIVLAVLHSTSAWKMKLVCFIIVFTSSFSGWFGFNRSISVFSIIFPNATLCKPDISDMSYELQEGEKSGHCQKLVKTIFWPVVGLHVQDEQEVTQFLPSGSWYLIWVSEKLNLECTDAYEQARGSHFPIVQLHKTQMISVVLILHHFTYKQESRIWQNRYILCTAAWLTHSIKSKKVFVKEIH